MTQESCKPYNGIAILLGSILIAVAIGSITYSSATQYAFDREAELSGFNPEDRITPHCFKDNYGVICLTEDKQEQSTACMINVANHEPNIKLKVMQDLCDYSEGTK